MFVGWRMGSEPGCAFGRLEEECPIENNEENSKDL